MRKLASLFVTLALWATQSAALDLALPQGARALLRDVAGQDRYDLPIAAFDGAVVPTEALEGRITRETWRIDTQSLTNTQIIAPLRQALEDSGFTIRLDCSAVTCGGFEFRFGTEVVAAPNMFVDLNDYAMLTATSDEGGVGILVSGSQSARFVQIIRAGKVGRETVKATAKPKEPVVIGSLGQSLEETGRVVLDDLNFETGSSKLSDGTYQSLSDLAQYLAGNPNRKVALVGHTDAVGALEGNIALSRKRAEAVLSRLTTQLNVNATQLEAGGMGYLAPRASNLTEEGRAANRRVEAVLTSTK